MLSDGSTVSYRADERFAFCSTFKLLLVADIIHLSDHRTGLLQQAVSYSKSDIKPHSPITGKHIATGMKVDELCAAAVEYSDNTAANLLLKLAGGRKGLNGFVRSMGDQKFRLDRGEPELNSAVPGDPRDTTTPRQMALDLKELLFGHVLSADGRKLLTSYLVATKTGDGRIRAAVPSGWKVGDKTGTGDYGAANDVAVIWPSKGSPIFLAVFTSRSTPKAEPKDAFVAAAAKIAMRTVP